MLAISLTVRLQPSFSPKARPMTSIIHPLPHHADRVCDALSEVLELTSRPTSVVVFAGDDSARFRSYLLLTDPERLHFLWPTHYGVVAVRDETEAESVIWAETLRLRWKQTLATGVAGPGTGATGFERFRAAFVAMGKARSLGGGLTIGAGALLAA